MLRSGLEYRTQVLIYIKPSQKKFYSNSEAMAIRSTPIFVHDQKNMTEVKQLNCIKTKWIYHN